MKSNKTSLDDAGLRVPELIEKYGYPSEEHTVKTIDGYILVMHRIPHGKHGKKQNGVPIILVHGLMASSADWIIAGPGSALGYILADAGYDVWLANCRGNRYSRNHTTILPNCAEFWNFSFHEIGCYDLPAMIDYILKQTKRPKLYYIGHSQGTTVSYVLCSEKPHYSKKIGAILSIAPIGFMSNMASPILRFLSAVGFSVEYVTSLVGHLEFMPHSRLLSVAAKYFALDASPLKILLNNSMFLLCGFTPKKMNKNLLSVIMGHTPSGASIKQVLHYGQGWRSGRFCQWDRGYFINRVRFGQWYPPEYDLDQIKCPVYLFYSQNDWVSHERDVRRLFLRLVGTNNKEAILVGDGRYNHLDYLYATEAPVEFYPIILKKLEVHTGVSGQIK